MRFLYCAGVHCRRGHGSVVVQHILNRVFKSEISKVFGKADLSDVLEIL